MQTCTCNNFIDIILSIVVAESCAEMKCFLLLGWGGMNKKKSETQ